MSALHDYTVDAKSRLKAFDAGLASLASRPDGSFVGTDAETEAELARIGRDRAARPDLYARLLARYTQPSNPMARASGPPPPTAGETNEGYRLVWEYLLLRPTQPDEVVGTSSPALDALAQIGNDACVPVLVAAFDKGFDQTQGFLNTLQPTVIQTLESIPSARSLDAILDCAAAAERQLLRLDAKISAMPDRVDRLNASNFRWAPLDLASQIGATGGGSELMRRWGLVLASYKARDSDPLKARALSQAVKLHRAG